MLICMSIRQALLVSGVPIEVSMVPLSACLQPPWELNLSFFLCWLHHLRNTQGRIYKNYIRNIHRYLWQKKIRNTDLMGRRRRRRLCFWLFCIIDICGYSLYVPYIFHIFPKYVPYIFPCVFLNLWSQEWVRTWPKSNRTCFRIFI